MWCDLVVNIAGAFAGTLLAAGLAYLEWLRLRKRRRKSLATVLFYDAKFARLDWRTHIEKGTTPPVGALLPMWRSLQHEAVDLFGPEIMLGLTEAVWSMDRTEAGMRLNQYGLEDVWMKIAIVERDFAHHAGIEFDGSTAIKLAEAEDRWAKLGRKKSTPPS